MKSGCGFSNTMVKPPYWKLLPIRSLLMAISHGWLPENSVKTGPGRKIPPVTHTHLDHMNGYPYFKRTFPGQIQLFTFLFLTGIGRRISPRFLLSRQRTEPRGEPLYLIHAPKHSPEDLLVIFRGAVCTGDWALGEVMIAILLFRQK